MAAELVSYSDSGVYTVGGNTLDISGLQNCIIGCSPSVYSWCYPVYMASKTEQAFKIVAKLLEKKVIEELTVSKFIALVNEIAEIL